MLKKSIHIEHLTYRVFPFIIINVSVLIQINYYFIYTHFFYLKKFIKTWMNIFNLQTVDSYLKEISESWVIIKRRKYYQRKTINLKRK